jgi:P27 family predicted phage terminase small subunit
MKSLKNGPPGHLSTEGKNIWTEIISEYSIDDAAGLRILRVACESFDRAQSARETIEKDGLTTIDKAGQIKPHPLLACERDSRAAFLAGLKALNLDLEPLRDKPGRPPGR